jgi:hypothetical protein
MFAGEIRKRRVAHERRFFQWRWHLDEVFVINAKLCTQATCRWSDNALPLI